ARAEDGTDHDERREDDQAPLVDAVVGWHPHGLVAHCPDLPVGGWSASRRRRRSASARGTGVKKRSSAVSTPATARAARSAPAGVTRSRLARASEGSVSR